MNLVFDLLPFMQMEILSKLAERRKIHNVTLLKRFEDIFKRLNNQFY